MISSLWVLSLVHQARNASCWNTLEFINNSSVALSSRERCGRLAKCDITQPDTFNRLVRLILERMREFYRFVNGQLKNTYILFLGLHFERSSQFPWQLPTVHTSGRKCISIFECRPLYMTTSAVFTLKLKRPFLYPRIFASFVVANKSRISEYTRIRSWVALGFFRLGFWSISIISSRLSNPEMLLNFPGFSFRCNLTR